MRHHGRMLRFLPMLLVLGLGLVAVIDCLSSDDEEVRGLPKVVWVFVILLFPLLGSLAWFFAGRPRKAGAGPRWQGFRAAATGSPRRSVAPDDDPDFLRSLDERPRPDEEDERGR